jgi:mannonate dehydratase
MNRREFVRLTGGGMTVGTQHGDSDAILKVLPGFGVNHICSRLPAVAMGPAWSVDRLSRLRERVESFGITLDMVPLPLSSLEISRSYVKALIAAVSVES